MEDLYLLQKESGSKQAEKQDYEKELEKLIQAQQYTYNCLVD